MQSDDGLIIDPLSRLYKGMRWHTSREAIEQFLRASEFQPNTKPNRAQRRAAARKKRSKKK